jgi:hypothetical protein
VTAHEISYEQIGSRWLAKCSCGKYSSTGYAYKKAAESAGQQHLRAKRRAAA